MLMDKTESVLLLVDVQEKLTPYVLNANGLVSSCKWLLKLANALDVTCIVSEQYPSGLGSTVASLQAETAHVCPKEKVHFSCYADETFIKDWQALAKRQVVIAGIETHVCVLQTAMLMKAAGVEVFVVSDAVSSRNEQDKQYGLTRMQHQGIQLVTREMVFFEWLRKAGTSEFKALSKAFLQ